MGVERAASWRERGEGGKGEDERERRKETVGKGERREGGERERRGNRVKGVIGEGRGLGKSLREESAKNCPKMTVCYTYPSPLCLSRAHDDVSAIKNDVIMRSWSTQIDIDIIHMLKSRPQTKFFVHALQTLRKIGSGHFHHENWGMFTYGGQLIG